MNDLIKSTKEATPVECLGMTFQSEDARREYFLKLLAEKLKDPDFRNQEGFPQGTDEAILAMSDSTLLHGVSEPLAGGLRRALWKAIRCH